MPSESDPVAPDEIVLRLVWHEFFKTKKRPGISASCFRPKRNESAGISVFRAACLPNPTDALLALDEAKRPLHGIVALPVLALLDAGLSVIPDPIAAVPGHALIPEPTPDAIASDKIGWEMKLEDLAVLASAHVVHQPGDPL